MVAGLLGAVVNFECESMILQHLTAANKASLGINGLFYSLGSLISYLYDLMGLSTTI
jgi:hypothetical protein